MVDDDKDAQVGDPSAALPDYCKVPSPSPTDYNKKDDFTYDSPYENSAENKKEFPEATMEDWEINNCFFGDDIG